MKVDIIKKFKWYIVGFILVAIMLSVSLSFCAWDTLSVKAKMSASKSGSYKAHIKLVDDIFLTNGNKGVNGIADVGDIVTFGNYYQAANNTAKSAIRWIVVEKVGAQLTLLAEKVMAFGSFWGTKYYNGYEWVFATQANGSYYQNYSQSTIRAWLNSNYTLRNDDGTAFSATNSEPRFRGFLSEAFTADEQKHIVSKSISGIMGYGKSNNPSTPTQAYATVVDKVWIPSWSELYGTTTTDYGTTIDGSPSTMFSYFKHTDYKSANAILIGKTTAFASSQYSNYTFIDATHKFNHENGSGVGANVSWWLRSPKPSTARDSLIVANNGSGADSFTGHAHMGVRPAVNVQL